MKSLLFTLLFNLSSLSNSPQPNILLREFMRDVAAGKLSDVEIGDKYFCTQILHLPDENGMKARSIVAYWIKDLRHELEKQHVSLDEVTFSLYSDLPDETMEIMGGAQNVYVARYRGTSFWYFYLKGDKIASLSLIDQGSRGFFYTICQ